MISSSSFYSSPHLIRPPLHPPPRHPHKPISASLPQNNQTPQNNSISIANSHETTFRKHNSKSTSLLLHHLSNPNPQSPETHFLPDEEKLNLLELSLVRKRTPQFPGSIYVQSPSDSDVGSSLPPLKTLFQGEADDGYDGEDRKLIIRAIGIRRKVTQEIFMEAMRRKGKFGITYTTNLVGRLGDFVDYVMIQAALKKQSPEFERSSFNVRVKDVIRELDVVSLIR